MGLLRAVRGPTAGVFSAAIALESLCMGRPLLQANSWSPVLPGPASAHLPFCSQISPQVYQCLSFTDLKPIQQPDFMMHKILDQVGRHIRWVASDMRSDMEAFRGQIPTDMVAGSPAATPSSLSMVSVGQSPSNWSTSLKPLSSTSFLRPSSASPAHSGSSTPPHILGLLRRGQRPQGQMLSPSCSTRSPGEPPSCPL